MNPIVSNTERAEPSETPRTDLQVQVGASQGHPGYVHTAYARVLEMELQHVADETAELRQLNAVLSEDQRDKGEQLDRYAEIVAGLRKRVGELECYRDICNKVIKDDETEFDRLNSLLELAQDEAAELRARLKEMEDHSTKLERSVWETGKQLATSTAALELAQGDKEDAKNLDWLEAQANGLIIWRGTLAKDSSPIVDIHEPREEGLDAACGEELSQGCTVRAAINSARGSDKT